MATITRADRRRFSRRESRRNVKLCEQMKGNTTIEIRKPKPRLFGSWRRRRPGPLQLEREQHRLRHDIEHDGYEDYPEF